MSGWRSHIIRGYMSYFEHGQQGEHPTGGVALHAQQVCAHPSSLGDTTAGGGSLLVTGNSHHYVHPVRASNTSSLQKTLLVSLHSYPCHSIFWGMLMHIIHCWAPLLRAPMGWQLSSGWSLMTLWF